MQVTQLFFECEACRKTYFWRYEEAAELTPRLGVLSSASLATLHRVGLGLALSE
jgi:hypothetical protein